MKKAFTMIELIFVVVIIAILAAVVIPKLEAQKASNESNVQRHEQSSTGWKE